MALGHAHHTQSLPSNPLPPHALAHALAPLCLARPRLTALGIRTELWLGEDDSISSARYLFAHPAETARDLLAVAARHLDIAGFNIDLESGGGNSTDVQNFAAFLGTVTAALRGGTAAASRPLRFSADVGCGMGGAPLLSDCAPLIGSGVDRLMTMRTYNAISYEAWIYGDLAPALALRRPDVLGVGLGCWVDGRTNQTWSTTPISASQRACYLMNQSVQEIEMFTIRQGQADARLNFPEPFWIAPLRQYMSGAGCAAEIPQRTVCPKATVGPADSWVPGGDAPHCCVSFAKRGDAVCNRTCAQAECAADPGMVWKPENYSIHPYTCCRA